MNNQSNQTQLVNNQTIQLLPPAQSTQANNQTQPGNNQTRQLLPPPQIIRRNRSGIDRSGVSTTIRDIRPTETQIALGSLHIREAQNTSLWITGLSGDITYGHLLRYIRGAGRVKQSHIYPPNEKNPNNSAARITFFTNQGARNLLIQANIGAFSIDGRVPSVVWNRHNEPERPSDGLSRVLRILGPHSIVNRSYLESFWSQFFYWEVDRVSDIGELTDDNSVIWYYFACWKGQAEAAKGLLDNHFAGSVTAAYVRDPCGKV